MAKIAGNLVATGMKVAIVHSRFNDFINEHLVRGAVDTLERFGANSEDIDTVLVPGAFEIPLIAKKLAQTGKYDAIICLGSVIKGSTTHYDYVCNEAAKGIASVGLEFGLPVIFGVLTTNSIEQAIERAGTKLGNKGAESAMNTIEMVNVLREIKK